MSKFQLDYVKKPIPAKVTMIGLVLLLIGSGILGAGFMSDHVRAAFNMNIIYMFLLSVGIGSIFIVALEYIAGAVWSVPFRRVNEVNAGIFWILPILAIPLLLNMHDMFHWTHQEAVEGDKFLTQKAPYLNESFFYIRSAAFFLIMILFYTLFTRLSKRQDKTGEQKLTGRAIKMSAMFLPIFGIGVTIMSIDWIMSLEPHWFSTIFGVYYFSGSLLTGLALLTFVAITLHQKGYLSKYINKDHYYNFGALLFAFTNFWAYIGFSQFLLIWYSNIPEETFWYILRMDGGWGVVSLMLIIIRFAVPYFALVAQPAKSNPTRLKFMSIWIMFAHILDLYWLIMPTFSKEAPVFGWMELSLFILPAGVIILVFAIGSKKKNMLPIGDPKLQRGLEFHL